MRPCSGPCAWDLVEVSACNAPAWEMYLVQPSAPVLTSAQTIPPAEQARNALQAARGAHWWIAASGKLAAPLEALLAIALGCSNAVYGRLRWLARHLQVPAAAASDCRSAAVDWLHQLVNHGQQATGA